MKVLIVDDSMAMRMIIRRSFCQAGFEGVEFLEAPNGAAALGLFDPHAVDLVLSDWNMPEMDGITFAKEVRKKNRETAGSRRIPIIMVTSEGGEKKRNELLYAGVDGYLCKPFTPQMLESEVNNVLKKTEATVHDR